MVATKNRPAEIDSHWESITRKDELDLNFCRLCVVAGFAVICAQFITGKQMI